MLAVEEALARITASFAPLPSEWVHLTAAAGRVLAEDLVAERDQPQGDTSAMDGYALNRDDTSTEFRIVAEIPAGALSSRTIGAGECARVFTGAAIPPGANQVIMQEFAQRDGDIVSFSERGAVSNIRLRGEDAREAIVRRG